MATGKIARIVLVLAAGVAALSVAFSLMRDGGGEKASEPETVQATAAPVRTIPELEAEIKSNPSNVEAWQALGWAYFEAGRYGNSVHAYRRATELAPEQAVLWSSLGEAVVMASENDPMPKEAVTAFETAIAKDKADPRARYFLAVRRDLQGDHQGAINDWFALLADTPPGAPWEADLRRTISQVADINKIDVKARLAAVQPAAHPSSVATAAIPGPSREEMQAASQLPPGQQQEMVQGMLEGLEGKLKADPANVQGWIMLMRSHMTLGERSQAAAAYKSAVAANPSQSVRIRDAARTLGVPGV